MTVEYRIYQDFDKDWLAERIEASPGIFDRIFGRKIYIRVYSTSYSSVLNTEKEKVDKILSRVGEDITEREKRKARDAFVPTYKTFSEEDYKLGKITVKEILKK